MNKTDLINLKKEMEELRNLLNNVAYELNEKFIKLDKSIHDLFHSHNLQRIWIESLKEKMRDLK